MIKRSLFLEGILANQHIGYGLLMVTGNGLGNSSYFGADEHIELESHGVVRNFHVGVFDGEFYLGSD